MIRVTIAAALLAFVVPVVADSALGKSQRELYGLMESMRSAAAALSFEGVIIYHHRDGGAQPARIVRNGDMEKIIFIDGKYRQVMHDYSGKATYLYSPDHYYRLPVAKLKRHAMTFTHPAVRSSPDVLRYYRFSIIGEEVIANRPVWVLAASPNDNWRYQHRFCIDKDTRLLLDMAIFDENQKEIERISYAALTFKDSAMGKIPQQLAASSSSGTAVIENMEEASWGFTRRLLPPGFVPSRRSMKINRSNRDIEQWAVTDGLVWVSVFMEDLNGRQLQQREDIRMAGLNMHTRTVAGLHITTVGAAPIPTLHRIAAAVHGH